ncbi:hypothetical protein VSDG_08277 [Cytospora chrysosperma]|uniref:BTB domain-containing protein n=1 Tax=Cytospora chrysosperma TaxID=252740 RepID=A0A423VIH2_CYTCH|nr:hypothetical protein VSDG_08277 [Valsa sordida]
MPSKKDGAGAAAAGKRQEQFRQRGDLQILRSGDLSDCIVMCGSDPDGMFTTHKVFLASRSGWFRKKMVENPQHDAAGKQVIEIDSHSPAEIALVMEFIYGAGMLDAIENSSNKSFIVTCADIYLLGRDFDISSMAEYAMNHLGKYLNTKLKEICVLPAKRARQAPVKHKFIQHLKFGIRRVDRAQKSGRGRELYKMLVDFVVAGREVILRNEDFQSSISQEIVPPEFIKEVMLTQYRGRFQTEWMKNVAVKPETLPNRLVKCVVCGMDMDLLGGEGAHYSPWSEGLLMSMYTEVCCSRCAQDEYNQDDDGMISWSVFKGDEYAYDQDGAAMRLRNVFN